MTDKLNKLDKDGPCHYCGEDTDSLSGNPGKWCIDLPHGDDPGVNKHHHTLCVFERLELADAMIKEKEIAAKALDHNATIREIFMRAADEMPKNENELNIINSSIKRAIDAMREHSSLLTKENVHVLFLNITASRSVELKKHALMMADTLIGLSEEIDISIRNELMDLMGQKENADIKELAQDSLDVVRIKRIERITALAKSLPGPTIG